jgi:hypothetical protein
VELFLIYLFALKPSIKTLNHRKNISYRPMLRTSLMSFCKQKLTFQDKYIIHPPIMIFITVRSYVFRLVYKKVGFSTGGAAKLLHHLFISVNIFLLSSIYISSLLDDILAFLFSLCPIVQSVLSSSCTHHRDLILTPHCSAVLMYQIIINIVPIFNHPHKAQ